MPAKNIPPSKRLGQNGAMQTRCLLALWLTIQTGNAFAANADLILDTAERHALLQTKNMPGKASIQMGTVDAERLPECTALEAFTPRGGRMIGQTYIGVRCLTPNSWSILVPAHIAVTGNYVATSHALIAGHKIQAVDLVTLSGDVSNLPTGAVVNPGNAIGKILRNSLAPGQILKSNQLQAPQVIRQGQTVKVISSGTGFSVSAEGKALSNASAGDVIQVRMSSGQTVSGIAEANGTVNLSN